ncbi:hypothetical protein SAMN05660690_0833 [Geodermatophilus telluris]|uniref:OLD protein-like TOPRIM domain-containing protein n=1 Tax=Geodermatophilus telluris TaxID=1190417 RepID=A0A1G6JHP0_9ACTN|nr:TOPRIM nucleotidyl transferase/hydrolase domain-containing protein [Geodermatophilus telluris]SDC18250.1 hypothetical protein SAMN05660690_0833 [Geodermatophilus telluris]
MPEPGPLVSALRTWAARGVGDEEAAASARRLCAAAGTHTVVLVEGLSDHEAVVAVAAAQGRNLAAEGVCVVPMGGATNVRRHLAVLGPRGLDVRVAGLYDAAEEPVVRAALARHGSGPEAPASRADLARRGFFACVADLEDELIRAVGTAGVEAVVREQGESRGLATLRHQPAHRGRPPEQQLHRFLGTTSGRKARYARALAERLDPSATPAPLEGLLAATRLGALPALSPA